MGRVIKSIYTLIVAVLLIINTVQIYAEENSGLIIMEENFNNVSTGNNLPVGWDRLNPNGSKNSVTIVSKGDNNKCIQLISDYQTIPVQALRYFSEQSAAIYIEFDFMADALTTGTSRFYIGDSSGPAIRISMSNGSFFAMDGGASAEYNKNLSVNSGLQFEKNIWYHYKVYANAQSNKFSVYINNVLVADNFSFSSMKRQLATIYTTLSPASGNYIKCFFDNIRVVRNPDADIAEVIPTINGAVQIPPPPANSMRFDSNIKKKKGLQSLKISDDKRYITYEDGTPFYYLADVSWSLFYRMKRYELDQYLRDRAGKEFTVIQTNVSGGDTTKVTLDGLSAFHKTVSDTAPPNPQTNPLDPNRPNEQFFENVDWFVNRANELGLYVALSPAYGINVTSSNAIFTTVEEAYNYGKFIGSRYKDKFVIWVLGVDSNIVIDNIDYSNIWGAMADGIRDGDEGAHLITYLPQVGSVASERIANKLDFYMNQSGHTRFSAERNVITLTDYNYNFPVTKPTIDGESGFEGIADGLSAGGTRNNYSYVPDEAKLTAFDIRTKMYWGTFKGSFGSVYGANGVFNCSRDETDRYGNLIYPDTWTWGSDIPWYEALNRPGSNQVKYLKRLMQSRPMLKRIPNQNILAYSDYTFYDTIIATCACDKSYAFIYTTSGKPVAINSGSIFGSKMYAWWYNPRDGSSMLIGKYDTNKIYQFFAPTTGDDNDWVLVLDNADMNFSPPGQNMEVYAQFLFSTEANNVIADVTLRNNSDGEKAIYVIVVSYKEDKMEGTKVVPIKLGFEEVLEQRVSIEAVNADRIKVFIWERNSLEPYISADY